MCNGFQQHDIFYLVNKKMGITPLDMQNPLLRFRNYSGPGNKICRGERPLFTGLAKAGREDCKEKCMLNRLCMYYSTTPAADGHIMCTLTAKCKDLVANEKANGGIEIFVREADTAGLAHFKGAKERREEPKQNEM